MATFSDLATLLLTFFVLLLSFANMDIQNFQMALGSVKDAFGVQFDMKGDFEARSTSILEWSDKQSSPRMQVVDPEGSIIRNMKKEIEKRGLSDKVTVSKGDRGITLRLRDMVLFGPGSAVLLEQAHPALNLVAEFARGFAGQISIEGHTDDAPMRSKRFPTNWELSTARATAVLRYFIDRAGLPPKRLQVAGFAHVKPLAPNNSPENRARNRRVEFVFQRGKDRPLSMGRGIL